MLKDVGALAVALLLLALCLGLARAAYPLVAGLWQPDEREQRLEKLQKSAQQPLSATAVTLPF